MRILLDTHVLLWWLMDSPRLTASVVQLIGTSPKVHVSPVTLWEIGLKQAKGKLAGFDDAANEATAAGFVELPVLWRHAHAATRLPPVHGDPFDRMLVAQAQVEQLTLVTADATIARYDVSTVTP